MNFFRLCWSLWIVLLMGTELRSEDIVEFLSGAKMTGTVTEIRKEAKEFDFEAKIGSRTVSRTYPFAKVHAVTYRGSRFVLTPMTASDSKSEPGATQVKRSVTEINRLIDQVGSSLPDWFESTELDHPPGLDLSWPIKVEGPWNNRKNVGQYIWDVVNPNPGRWKSGIKLVHHCMSLHQGKSELVDRDMKTLGRMYFDLLQDYPRAAYWFQRADVEKGTGAAVKLAECYWRLGNAQLATRYLISRTYQAGAAASAIKLYANMGRFDEALKMTQRFAGSPAAYEGFIAAGDAMRQAGRFDEAIRFYERVLGSNAFRNKDYEDRFKTRAQESIDAIEMFEKVDVRSLSDGTYEGGSTGYNGQLQVEVTVDSGKIVSVQVVDHNEKQFYSALTDTENAILRLQTVRGVDGTSGATITSRAIVNATAKALAGNPQ
jgi:uncharacterized protein with FMN-binding domain